MRGLIFLGVVAGLAGCAGKPRVLPQPEIAHVASSVQIAPGASLRLPLPPGYPQARSLQQFVRAQHGARRGSFEAALSLSPERVEIVIIAPSGPRLASLAWDEHGITHESADAPPGGAPIENIVGDIFLCFWPIEAVRAALPEGMIIQEGAAGARTISQLGVPVVEIKADGEDAGRLHLRNYAFDYQLLIETRP